MRILGSLRNGRNSIFCILVLSCVFFFAADIVDLRDELLDFDSLYHSFDNNITAGIQSDFFFDNPHLLISGCVIGQLSAVISCFRLLPYSVRAPPTWS